MTLISHLESTLGKIDQGWSFSDGTGSVQVVRFLDKPFDGVATYTTLGLSDHILSMPQGREVRQEFLFSTYETYSSEEIASFLISFCDYILGSGNALLRGDIIGPSAPLIKNVKVNSLYASIPAIFDESFSTYRLSSPDTVIVWLLPLLKEEALFVKAYNWSRFEDILEGKNPDLMNLNRVSIV